MRHLLALFLAAALSSAAFAQDQGAEEDGQSLMERGLQLFMDGLLSEMEPALGDLQDLAEEMGPALQSFLAEMGPALRGLLQEIEDWSVYEAPEVLENGDIIIRRKKPEPSPAVPDSDPIEI